MKKAESQNENITNAIYGGALSAAMLLAGCYSTDTDDDLLSTATLISIYPSTVSVGSAAATQNVVVTLAPKSKRNLDWSCSVSPHG